jgi:hypothetical protein
VETGVKDRHALLSVVRSGNGKPRQQAKEQLVDKRISPPEKRHHYHHGAALLRRDNLETSMDVSTRSGALSDEALASAISWASIAAGAVAACALTLLLMALGAGIGLSSVSPWSGSGVSATTFKVGSGIYLVIIAVMASAIGGYLAARLRTKWSGLNTNEAFFRDSAHGFLAWAFATILTASVLASAASAIVGGAAQGLGMAVPQAAAQASGPADLVVDRLLRPADTTAPATTATPAESAKGELSRLLVASFRDSGDVSASDRAYIARVVSARTGLPSAEAERRVAEVITEAKQAIDKARKAAAQLALWLTASLLFGAFAASLAAVEGGQQRDGTWEGRRLSPREI